MIHKIKFLSVFLSVCFWGQIKIGANSHQFVSVNFPANIEHIKSSMPDVIDVQQQQDNIFIQYLTDRGIDKPANILVKTFDGYYYSLIVNYDENPKQLNYFFTQQNSLHKITPVVDNSLSTNKKNIPQQNRGGSEFDNISENIVSKGGYIKIRNIVKNKKMEMIHKGVYFEKNKLFFHFLMKNQSHIPFEVESYVFEVITIENDRSSSQSQLMTPTHIFNRLQTITPKSENDIVFVLDLFTISENKKLQITINEKGGDRTLIYEVAPKILSETRIIK